MLSTSLQCGGSKLWTVGRKVWTLEYKAVPGQYTARHERQWDKVQTAHTDRGVGFSYFLHFVYLNIPSSFAIDNLDYWSWFFIAFISVRRKDGVSWKSPEGLLCDVLQGTLHCTICTVSCRIQPMMSHQPKFLKVGWQIITCDPVHSLYLYCIVSYYYSVFVCRYSELKPQVANLRLRLRLWGT